MSSQSVTSGNVVAAFIYRRGKNRAECSCGWAGFYRMFQAAAKNDVVAHFVRSGGRCQFDMPLFQPADRRTFRFVKAAKIVAIALSPLLLVPVWIANSAPAAADPLPSNCDQRFWLVPFQSNTRTICDGPIQADGSWERGRVFWSPAYVRPARSYCSSYGSCTFYPAQYVEETSQGIERYIVTPATVLADEPGHLA